MTASLKAPKGSLGACFLFTLKLIGLVYEYF